MSANGTCKCFLVKYKMLCFPLNALIHTVFKKQRIITSFYSFILKMKFLNICKRVKMLVSLLFISISLTVNAQTEQITGKVVDSNSKPLNGASVVIRTIKKGSITDADGNFSMRVPKGSYTLEVSFVGYTTIKKEIASGTKGRFNYIKIRR